MGKNKLQTLRNKVSKTTKSIKKMDTAETTLLIAKGSAAIAAAASAIAAGAFLADEGRRKRAVKGAREVLSRVDRLRSRLPEELPDAYYAVAHQVGRNRKGILRKATKVIKKKSSRR